MIFDALNKVSADQVVTSTAVSTNAIDLGVARDIGDGKQLYMLFVVKEAATAVGAATVTFELVDATDGALTSSVNALTATSAIPKAALTLGAMFAIPIPPRIGSLGQRYLGARYTVATGPLTAGKFDGFIVYDVPDTATFYPIRSTIT